MQVKHAVGEGVEHDGRDLAHVAGHDHVLRAGFLQRGHNLRISRLGVGVLFAVHDQHGDAGSVGTLDAVRIGTRRDHLHHLDGQALFRLIEDGLEIRAAAGEQHADLQLFGHETAFHQAAPNQPRDSHYATSIRAGGEASPRSRQAPSSIQGEGERERTPSPSTRGAFAREHSETRRVIANTPPSPVHRERPSRTRPCPLFARRAGAHLSDVDG